MAIFEEFGAIENNHPIPNSFPQSDGNSKFSYAFLSTNIDTAVDGNQATGRWASGRSIDGKGEFTFQKAMPYGEKPILGPPHPNGFAQQQQMKKQEDSFIKSAFQAL
jgi:Mn-containing catalase